MNKSNDLQDKANQIPSYFYPNLCFYYEGIIYEHQKAQEVKKMYLQKLKNYLYFYNKGMADANLGLSDQGAVVINCSLENETLG